MVYCKMLHRSKCALIYILLYYPFKKEPLYLEEMIMRSSHFKDYEKRLKRTLLL